MLKKALVSPIALAFGLALTGAAAAQTMVGEHSISEADLPRVQEHCDALLAEDTDATSGISSDANDVETDDAEGSDTATEPGDLSFESITLEQCREAGLVD